MFWNVKQTALFLEIALHKVYYLIVMGEIEAVKVGKAWRITPDSARAYGTKKAA